jgi:hypothetical protein
VKAPNSMTELSLAFVYNLEIPRARTRAGGGTFVREKGLEPSRSKAQEPKSCVSANFTTPASAVPV